MTEYQATTGDLIVHNSSRTHQSVYRVIGVFLGTMQDDGFVELACLGTTTIKRQNLDIMVPVPMFEQMVVKGILECVWREEP